MLYSELAGLLAWERAPGSVWLFPWPYCRGAEAGRDMELQMKTKGGAEKEPSEAVSNIPALYLCLLLRANLKLLVFILS